MMNMPMVRVASPTPSRNSDHSLPPSVAEFQVERVLKSPIKQHRSTLSDQNYEEAAIYRESVGRFLGAKDRPFTVSGRIPLDSSQLVLFFRSKSGITHSLDFPIDVDYSTPPALDVLIAACRPHQTSEFDDYPERESLFYPPNLPLSASLDIANHPILDAIRATLFPHLPPGNYLNAVRDKLEVVCANGRMTPQPRSLRSDGRSATIIITLPVRFRGGALVVANPEGSREKYMGRGGKNGDVEWAAFLPDCEYEVETVERGCRLSISYAVFLRSFEMSTIAPDPLIQPSDIFLDLLAPILNLSRGRKIGFFLNYDYPVNPSEQLADSLIPLLKAGDALLYTALKLYKLSPVFYWTAGGYLWPADHVVAISGEDPSSPSSSSLLPQPLHHPSHQQHSQQAPSFPKPAISPRKGQGHRGGTDAIPPVHGVFSNNNNNHNNHTGRGDYAESDAGSEGPGSLRARVEESGAIPLGDADITILTDPNAPEPLVGKERVYFVSRGELEKLVVNVLVVAFVP